MKRRDGDEIGIGQWVDELMTAGCMPKVAARVVTEVFAAGVKSGPFRDEAAERRRKWDRERKAQNLRERKSAESGGIPVEKDPIQRLWTDGVGLLRQLGVGDKIARGNIGRWLKASADPSRVFKLIADAHSKGIGDPVPWITMGLGTQNGARNPTMAAFDDLLSRTEGGTVEENPPMRDITPRGDQGG